MIVAPGGSATRLPLLKTRTVEALPMFRRRRLPWKVCESDVVPWYTTDVPRPRSTHRYVASSGTTCRRTDVGFGLAVRVWFVREGFFFFFASVDVAGFLLPSSPPPVRPRIARIATTTTMTTTIAVPGPGGPRCARGRRRSCWRRLGRDTIG